ncbi:MAG: efflux RND transporter periplasmic adaptor subunit [Cystobacterineae bacterium]|nr:efflux RND transporter periplasmic adaptor subunit [Cystobacterineae bacterium]
MKTDKTSGGEEDTALKKLLHKGQSRFFSRKKGWIFAGILVVAVGLFLLFRSDDKANGPRYKTEPATTGKLVVKVSATGNLQPVNMVDVGSELSGIITEVFVDNNDFVKTGQVLAQLDLSKLKDSVARSKADLLAAEAHVAQSKATAMEAHALLERYKQVSKLSDGKVPSKSEMDAAEANLKRAEANEAVAKATVIQAKANLQSDETNLAKASIRAPINGVVLMRNIEPGQTVAATFQAPVLFSLADDLAKMKLQVDVDEADVSQVKVGQQATFSVDAWTGRKYSGVITRVDFGSQTKDGVVSYPTLLEVNNDDLSLRPGMTATAEIITVTQENALLVPNAALRFSPPATAATPKKPSGSIMNKLMPMPRMRPSSPRKNPTAQKEGGARVWVLQEGQPVSVDVQTGPTNGQVTEIVGGTLEPGMEVITEMLGAAS